MTTKWKAVLYSALGFAVVSGAWVELNSKQGPADPVATSVPSAATSVPTSTTSSPSTSPTSFKDGTYTANNPTPWGAVTVAVTVKDGKWTTIERTAWPATAPSGFAAEKLVAQALAAQSATIDGVSGATYTSQAFRDDLTSIVEQSKA